MTNDESLSSTPPARRTWRQRIPFALLMVFTAVYALATAVSAWRTFTPVPIWDMWAAALEFYIDVHRGVGWDAWWRQVNEHRLVLPKALFWMEYTWFGGQQVFLIIMNYVLVGCGLAVFVVFLRARLPAMSGRSRFFGATLLALWLFSWVQKENLAWANQGQFFLAQLLPLAGFYCLYRAACAPSARGWFPAACTIGVLSVGTMANGVMALPMMVLYAAVTRLGWRRTAILAVLAAVCAGAYAVGYTSPSDHGGVFSKLRDRPLDMLSYILVYLGSPFQHFVLKQHSPSWTPLSQAFGGAFRAALPGPAAARPARSPCAPAGPGAADLRRLHRRSRVRDQRGPRAFRPRKRAVEPLHHADRDGMGRPGDPVRAAPRRCAARHAWSCMCCSSPCWRKCSWCR